MSKVSPLLPSHSCSFPLGLLRQPIDPPKLPRPRGPVQKRPQIEPVVIRGVALGMVRGRQRRRLVPVGRVRAPKGLDPGRDLRGRQVPPAAQELLKGGDGAAAGRVGSEAAELGEFLGEMSGREGKRVSFLISFFFLEKNVSLSQSMFPLAPPSSSPPAPRPPFGNRTPNSPRRSSPCPPRQSEQEANKLPSSPKFLLVGSSSAVGGARSISASDG